MPNFNPFTAPPTPQVALKNAPLVRVIAQIRFSPILSIENKNFVALFQEEIREKYPILQLEHTQLVFSPQAVEQQISQITWRFRDTADNWRVSLATNFMSLETTSYSNRHDFLDRLKNLLIALSKSFNPQNIERFGLRYIDRITGQELKDISSLVKPEIAGIISANFEENLKHTISESLFIIPNSDEKIVARWGLVPAGITFDPDAIEPISESSWILDIDMSLSKNQDFNTELLINQSQHFAERIYTFFRWVVKDEFLQRFGGQI